MLVCKDLARPVDLSKSIRKLWADSSSGLAAPAAVPGEAPVKTSEKRGLADSLLAIQRGGLLQGMLNIGAKHV